MVRTVLTGLVLCAACVAPASAAESVGTLTAVSGRVLVSSPAGLVLAHNGRALAEGTRVVVAAGGRVTVTMPSCTTTLVGGQEILVAKGTPCHARAAQASGDLVDGGQADGLFAGVGGLSTTTLVVGGVVLATGVAVVVRNNRDAASGS
jgi:hypothetical protein